MAVRAFGRHGATQDLAQRGVGQSGRGWHGSRTVLSERFGPPEWECEARVPWCGYSVLTSAECVFNLSIAAPADMGPVRVGHTMGQQ